MPSLHHHHHLLLLLLLAAAATSSGQPLSPSQSKTLLRLQRILEYPPPLSSWTPHTDFCSLPSTPSLSLSCSSGELTALSLSLPSPTPPLSPSFSSDSLFTTLSRLPSLTHLSLTSLGLHGPLPSKLRRFSSLLSLNLSSNHFNGTLPDLSPLTSLSLLDLSSNLLLGPSFPSLPPTSLTTLVLSHNSFHADIPIALRSFNRLQRLDLSSNNLVGPVPPFLFSLPSIQYLDLSDNRLAGALPARLSCGDGLGYVDVSSNLLVGSLPSCIRANSSGRVVLVSGNCLSSGDPKSQHPNSYCNEGALAAVLPPPTEKTGSKSRVGLMLGIAAGVIGGAVVIGLLLLVALRRGRGDDQGGNMQQQKKTVAGKALETVATLGRPADKRHMSQAVRMGTLGLMPYRVFTMEELEEATNNFDRSNLIDQGPRGQFYKGWLRDGSTAVVRCMKLKQRHSPQSLIQYMDIISKLRHCHLVSILGHCICDNDHDVSSLFLVLEYVSNGSLRSHLTEWRKHEMMKWPQRVAAVIGIARGIQFLHAVTEPGIVGNDLNIENILLDETLTAKISNYNLPMLPRNKNNKIGSESPFSPVEEGDLGSNRSLEHGEKEDVYQLGLILLEVITGKPAESQNELDKLKVQLQKSLNDEPSRLRGMADSKIRGTYAYESLRTAVEITLNCVAKDPKERPSIDDILWNLQYSIQVQDGWASSGNLSTQSY